MADQSQRQYLDKVPVELQDLLYAGRRIEAIKLAREKLGWGLKEAKERVDNVEAEMRSRFPGALPDRKTTGCDTALFVMGIALALGVFIALKIIR